MQLPAEEEINEDDPMLELGVDSLVAVEVRLWFLEEANIDVPVLRVLAGASIADLIEETVKKLPQEMLPKIAASTSETLESSISINEVVVAKPALDDASIELKGIEIQPKTAVVERKERMSLSQSRFWFLRHYLDDQTTFNITFSMRLVGNLRINDFKNAVHMVGQRHEALRTSFFSEPNEMSQPMQGVLRESTLQLEQKTIATEEEVGQEFSTLQKHIYDIEAGENIRIVLLTLSSNKFFVLIGYPHITMDGVSFQILLSDLERAYNGQKLAPVACQYAQFSSKQRRAIESGELKDELAFWQKEFPSIPPTLPLFPFAKTSSRRILKKYGFSRADFRVNPILAANIKEGARRLKVTAFHVYIAALKALLFRFLDTEELCIGIADANRTEANIMGTVGLFLNLLPLRFQRKSSETFENSVKDVRNKTYSSLANSKLPFDVLLDELAVHRSADASPMFQAFVDYRQGAKETQSFGNCEGKGQQWEVGRNAYDISLDIIENPDGDSLITLKVQKYLYDQSHAEIIMRSYCSLLEAFTADFGLLLNEAPLYRAVDIQEALSLGRGKPPALLGGYLSY